jgi:hypothetical protein
LSPTWILTAQGVYPRFLNPKLTYYDFRRLPPGNKAALPTDYWFKTSNPWRDFSPDLHVAGPFNMLAAPVAGGPLCG